MSNRNSFTDTSSTLAVIISSALVHLFVTELIYIETAGFV